MPSDPDIMIWMQLGVMLDQTRNTSTGTKQLHCFACTLSLESRFFCTLDVGRPRLMQRINTNKRARHKHKRGGATNASGRRRRRRTAASLILSLWYIASTTDPEYCCVRRVDVAWTATFEFEARGRGVGRRSVGRERHISSRQCVGATGHKQN